MTRIALLAVTLLVGCGGPNPRWTCEGSGFSLVSADTDWDEAACGQFLSLSDLSRRILVDSGAVTAAQLDANRSGMRVDVLDAERFNDPIHGSLLGRNDGNRILIGVHLSILAHEELHTIDGQRGELLTTFHAGWESKGYLALDDLAVFTSGDWTRNCAGHRKLTPDQRANLLAKGWPVLEWEADTACEGN